VWLTVLLIKSHGWVVIISGSPLAVLKKVIYSSSPHRMFCSAMDLKPNEDGEYEVAKGVSANIFRALMVRGCHLVNYTHCTNKADSEVHKHVPGVKR